ncbi:hypothetical protein D3C86_1745950 [compost metagenome]
MSVSTQDIDRIPCLKEEPLLEGNCEGTAYPVPDIKPPLTVKQDVVRKNHQGQLALCADFF